MSEGGDAAPACSEEVEARFAGFYAATQSGHSLTEQLRKHRDFGNPYHLEEVITTFGIDDKGSGYPAHLWDPLSLPVDGHAEVLDAKQAQQEEARRARQAQRTAIVFSGKTVVESAGWGPGGLSSGQAAAGGSGTGGAGPGAALGTGAGAGAGGAGAGAVLGTGAWAAQRPTGSAAPASAAPAAAVAPSGAVRKSRFD